MLIISSDESRKHAIALNGQVIREEESIPMLLASYFSLHFILDIHYAAEKTMQVIEYFLGVRSLDNLLRPAKFLTIKCGLQAYTS